MWDRIRNITYSNWIWQIWRQHLSFEGKGNIKTLKIDIKVQDKTLIGIKNKCRWRDCQTEQYIYKYMCKDISKINRYVYAFEYYSKDKCTLKEEMPFSFSKIRDSLHSLGEFILHNL